MRASTSRSRIRWLIYPALAAGFLLVAYFVVISPPFLRSVVVPRVGAALHSELTVGEIALSPFSSLTLRQIRLTPQGGETLLTAEGLRLRYRLTDLMRGVLSVSEMTLDHPVVTVVTAPDGTSNLSRTTEGSKGRSAATTEAKAPLVLNVRNVNLNNGVVRLSGPAGPGARTVELAGLNVALDSLVADAPGRVKLASAFGLVAEATNGVSGQASGEFQFRLNEQLQLRELNGAFDLRTTNATGAWRDLGRLALNLTADSTGSEIRKVRLAVTEGGQPAGEIGLSGPFDPAKKEARIAYEVKGIGRPALSLAGALLGVDFGATRIEAEGRLDLERGGSFVAWQGRFSADPLTLGTASGSTPVLGLLAEFRVRADLNEDTALIEKADLTLRQGPDTVVRGALDRPMNLAWNSAAKGSREATYSLAVTQLDLAPWRATLGPDFPAGRLNLEVKVLSEREGRLLRVQMTGGLSDLMVAGGSSPPVGGLRMQMQAAGTLEDFQTLLLERISAELSQGAQRLAQSSGMAQVNLRSHDFSGQIAAEVALASVLKARPVEGVVLTAGTSTVSVRLGSQNGQTNGSLGVSLTGLTGNLHGVALRDYEAKLDLNFGRSRDKILLSQGSLSLRSGTDTAGSVALSGEFEPVAKRGEFSFKSMNLNEATLAPLLAGALQPRRLESVTVECAGRLQMDLAGSSSLASSLQVSRLVVRNPSARSPVSPLSGGAVMEASGRGRVFDLTKFAVTLPPTERARNELLATGQVEFATNSLTSGQIWLSSAGLDLTQFAEVLAGDPAPTPTAPTAVGRPTPTSRPGEPIHLPIGHLAVDTRLTNLFYRDIAVSNWVTRVEIKQDHVVVNPLTLFLNGAPVSASADVNLGVPGYVYDLKGSLSGVPVPPLAKSLLSADLVDLSGTINATLDLKGAGVDGVDLRQHLAGHAALAATNLNYSIASLKTPLMRELVRTLSTSLRIPSISESPIRTLETRVTAGQGVVTLASAQVSSDAFRAGARGGVRIADLLTNSPINLPVTVSLPHNSAWAELPTFLTFRGTLGDPRPNIDALALARTLTQLPGAAGGLSNAGVDRLGGALDRALGGRTGTNTGAGTSLIRGLLGNRPADTNAPGATNGVTSTNTAPAPFNPLDLFKKKPAQP